MCDGKLPRLPSTRREERAFGEVAETSEKGQAGRPQLDLSTRGRRPRRHPRGRRPRRRGQGTRERGPTPWLRSSPRRPDAGTRAGQRVDRVRRSHRSSARSRVSEFRQEPPPPRFDNPRRPSSPRSEASTTPSTRARMRHPPRAHYRASRLALEGRKPASSRRARAASWWSSRTNGRDRSKQQVRRSW